MSNRFESMFRNSASDTDGLVLPVAFAALAVLAINDKVLKPEYHNALTGKLSDLAGLVLVPLVAFVGLELLLPLANRPKPTSNAMLRICVATGFGFASIQLIDPASAIYEAVLTTFGPGNARNTMDPTDLLTLPVLWLPWRIVTGSGRTQRRLSWSIAVPPDNRHRCPAAVGQTVPDAHEPRQKTPRATIRWRALRITAQRPGRWATTAEVRL